MQAFAGSPEPVPHELTWQADRLVSMESWVEQGDFLTLNVSYQLLAGVLPTEQSECHTFFIMMR